MENNMSRVWGGILATLFSVVLPANAFDPAQTLTYQGYFKLPGKPAKFSIHNKDTKYKKWIRVGDRTGDYLLRDYQEQDLSLVFERDGELGVLQLSLQDDSRWDGLFFKGSNPLRKIESVNLRYREGLYFKEEETTPYSGFVVKAYPSGRPLYERSYKDGKKHGPTIEWFSSGQKKYEMYYEENKRTGIWSYWDAQGNLTAKREYENNKFKRDLPIE